MKNLYLFENNHKIKFKNKKLIKAAFTHKSANRENNNEKLEFLGDRVLGLVLSRKLYELYPNESEGVLDKKFATLVKKKTCCEIGWSLNLQNYIITGDAKKKITLNDEKILSDCCEAVIGAIYLDRGFDYVSNFILKAWKKKIDKSNVTLLDAKTKLQEYSLKHFKKLPFYNMIGAKGPRHNPTYKISVSIIGSKKFYGYGNSKQEAEQDGANNLLKGHNIS